MGGTFRFAHRNFIYEPEAVLSASSFVETLPPSFVLDQLLSKVWRSDGPYVVIAGFNDAIDISEGGGELNATIVAGTYDTPTAYALAVKTALDAAGALTYTVVYSTNAYTIGAGANFSLLWQSGTNAARTAGYDLGYDVSANDTGSNSHSADFTSYQGQHYLFLDWSAHPTTPPVADVCIVIGHNVDAEGGFERREVLLQGSIGGFPTISHEQTLTLTDDGELIAELEAAPSTPWSACREYRLVFRDISNPDGFSECGVWFVGEIETPSIRPSINEARERHELSQIVQAIDGAAHGDIRPMQNIWSFEWLDLEDADLAILEGIFDAMPPGRCLFILPHSDDIEDVMYGFFAAGANITLVAAIYHNVTVVFVEALG